jgi:spore germination protein Q
MSSFNYGIGSSPSYNYPRQYYQQGTGGVMGGMPPATPPPTTSITPPPIPGGTPIYNGTSGQPTASQIPGILPLEQSYIENILRLNLGKVATFYMTYENNSQWNAKIFSGRIEAAGRDHIIISDPSTGVRTMLLMVNLDYATFTEPLSYAYPYQQQPQQQQR